MGTPLPPHYTPDLGRRTLTPNITQAPSPRKTAKTHEIAVFPSKSGQPVILTMVMLLEVLVMVNNTVDRISLIHCDKQEIIGSCCFKGGLWMATIFSTLGM